ncbi:hypothetical protein [Streptomyces sp. NPDC018045]|uniref:hypothetical protein n=1 Tax=Streptomyces sp. NPDC018045 TaxID=3365037 RepID=UPI0037A2D873
MTKLPTDATLRKLFHLGVSDKKIAEQYDVSVQAVNKRMRKMDLHRKPIATEVTDVLNRAWSVKSVEGPESHHSRRAMKGLKYFLRQQLGDQLTENQKQYVRNLLARVEAEGVVLDYDRDSVEGIVFRPRQPEDGRRILRWPVGIDLPEPRLLAAMDLPKLSEAEDGPQGGDTDDPK